jgi:hypothetical protein
VGTPENDRVYIHEYVNIIGPSRAHYMHHIAANWAVIAREERQQLCVGVWATVGITSRWPEVVNLWEDTGWDGIAASLEHEYSAPTLQDPSLAAWWAKAAEFRSGGVDRILVPAPWSPTVADLDQRKVSGQCYVHELTKLRPHGAPRYFDALASDGIDLHADFGFALVGAYKNTLVLGTECLSIWAVPTYSDWATSERARNADSKLANWVHTLSGLVTESERVLLADAPLSPRKLGRQPVAADRSSYELP